MTFRYFCIGVYSIIDDSTEVAIQKMIDASQRMLNVDSQRGEEAKLLKLSVNY